MESAPSGLVSVRYNRVSDDKRKLSRSVPEQEAEGLAAAAELGWTDGGSYSDTDMSASRFAKKVRPDWVKLVDDVLPSGRVHVLVLWEPSRGARLLSAWALLLETCQRLGILMHITSHQQTYNLSKPRHWKSLADDGVKAVYDSEETSLRVRRGVAGHAATGKPYGKILYGYERVYDPKTKEFVEQRTREDQAQVVRDAAEWIAANGILNGLVADLHERGIRSPRGRERWSTAQLKKMVLNPGYLGKRVHQGKVVGDGVWPAILEPEVQQACRRILQAEGRSKVRDGAVHHWLSGLVMCGGAKCGGPLRVHRSHGHLIYACVKGKCVGIRKDALEHYVEEVIFARLSRDDALELLADGSRADEASRAEQEAERLSGELEGFYLQAESNDPEERLSPLGLARMERKYVPLIEAANKRADMLRVPSALRGLARPDIAEHWPSMGMSQQREAIRSLMTIKVKPLGRGRKAPPEERVVIGWTGQI